jgi:hypothetical protein
MPILIHAEIADPAAVVQDQFFLEKRSIGIETDPAQGLRAQTAQEQVAVPVAESGGAVHSADLVLGCIFIGND